MIVISMLISGGMAGLAGAVELMGVHHRLIEEVSPEYGFTAIIIAWLAQLNPLGSLVIAFLFAVLEKGASVVQSEFGLAIDCADVLQGVILFFVLGCEFFIRYRFVIDGAAPKKGGKTDAAH